MIRKLVIAGALLLSATMSMSAADRYYEMRTYHTYEGKLDALLTRFRDHTVQLFEKHGMTNIGYWVPVDKPNTLIYILSYPSKEARDKSWADFQKDSDWVKARTASEANGKIVEKVDQVFMNPTDFSKLK